MIFSQCVDVARSCLATRDRDGFRITVRLAQSRVVEEAEVNRLLEEALTQFPEPRALELLDAAEALRRSP